MGILNLDILLFCAATELCFTMASTRSRQSKLVIFGGGGFQAIGTHGLWFEGEAEALGWGGPCGPAFSNLLIVGMKTELAVV